MYYYLNKEIFTTVKVEKIPVLIFLLLRISALFHLEYF